MNGEAKKDADVTIIFVTMILVGLGLVMVLSASYVFAQETRGDAYFFLKRQAVWAVLGIFLMFILSKFNYHNFRKLSLPFLGISTFLLLLLMIPGVGVEINEAVRWINVAGFSIQPSEFTKLAIIIFTAVSMSRKSLDLENFWSSSFVPIIAAGGSFLLIMLQPDFGTGMVLFGTTILIIIVAGIPMRHLGLMILSVIPVGIALIVSAPYRLARLTSFVDPWADARGAGWQIIQSLYALAPGGIFGMGLGRSRQKLYYLPEPHNDFIFAIIGEELGLIGTVSVIILFAIFVWRGLRIAANAPDSFGRLLASGIVFVIGIQVLVNIGVVTGSIPVTGINLPLISAGGSSLLFNLCGIGILLNISRHTVK